MSDASSTSKPPASGARPPRGDSGARPPKGGSSAPPSSAREHSLRVLAEGRVRRQREQAYAAALQKEQRQARRRKEQLLRGFGAAFATLLVLALALLYPWLDRGTEWLDAEWELGWALLALAIVPALWWWGTFGQDRRRPRMRIGSVAPLQNAPRGIRARLRDLPGVLRAVAVVMFVLALARPIAIIGERSADDEGIDIVLAIDLSRSMAAVLDADPRDLPKTFRPKTARRPSRLDTAKIVVQDFISRRVSDRIGGIVFGRHAYILSPPTLDYQLLSKLIGQLQLDVIDGNRTAIGDALGTAVARLEVSDARSKVIILLTDGDSNAGRYSPDEAIREAVKVGCKTYTIQIGNGEAVEMLVGYDEYNQPIYEPRVVPVNPELLKRIADRTGGEHFIATDAKGLRDSMHEVLNQLEKTKFEASITHHEELFPLFLIPGVLLIALEALLGAWLLRRFP